MIYDKLRTLPKVIQIDIYNTGNLSLLSDENTPVSELEVIWERLEEEFTNRFNRFEKTKIFNLKKEIDYQDNRWTIIKSAIWVFQVAKVLAAATVANSCSSVARECLVVTPSSF